jgi:hypothetical protein
MLREKFWNGNWLNVKKESTTDTVP